MAEELLEHISAWCQELVLRGSGQMGLRDLEKLESFAAEAPELQMFFLAELLQQLLTEGRRLLMGEGSEASFHHHFARLAQYTRLGSANEQDLSPD